VWKWKVPHIKNMFLQRPFQAFDFVVNNPVRRVWDVEKNNQKEMGSFTFHPSLFSIGVISCYELTASSFKVTRLLRMTLLKTSVPTALTLSWIFCCQRCDLAMISQLPSEIRWAEELCFLSSWLSLRFWLLSSRISWSIPFFPISFLPRSGWFPDSQSFEKVLHWLMKKLDLRFWVLEFFLSVR